MGNKLKSYFHKDQGLKKSYRYMALVSHMRHLPFITTPKEETLIVSSDWLLLDFLDKNNYDSLYYEYGLLNINESELEADMFIRCNDWIYLDGIDQSIYMGVSLGRLFARDISYIYIIYTRLYEALSNIIRIFKPEKIYLFDYRSEVGLLDDKSKVLIVEEVCQKKNIEFINLIDSPNPDDESFPQYSDYGLHDTVKIKYTLVKKLYSYWIDLASSMFSKFFTEHNKVALMCGGHLAQVLLDQKHISSKRLIVFASTVSRNPKKVFSSLIKGVYFSKPIHSNRKINFEILNEIVSKYKHAWQKEPDDVLTKIVRSYILKNVLSSKRIKNYCVQIDGAQHFYDKHKPEQILVDSLIGPDSRIAIELASKLNITVNYIWHGMWLQIMHFDAFGGDKRSKTLVNRVFSWGEQNDNWLNAANWRGDTIRVGGPFISKYSNITHKKLNNKEKQNVLVLQYTSQNDDVRGLNANQYGFFVNIVRVLNRIGVYNTRLKLHPVIWKKSYYEKIKISYGLNCEIRDDGPFEKHLEWADIVIGPAQSGAFLEALASKKYYYPVVLSPHSKMVEMKKTKVYKSIDELEFDLVNKKQLNQDDVFEEISNFQSSHNPSQVILDILLT